MNYSYMRHDLFIYETWLLHGNHHMTHITCVSHMWYTSYDTYHIIWYMIQSHMTHMAVSYMIQSHMTHMAVRYRVIWYIHIIWLCNYVSYDICAYVSVWYRVIQSHMIHMAVSYRVIWYICHMIHSLQSHMICMSHMIHMAVCIIVIWYRVIWYIWLWYMIQSHMIHMAVSWRGCAYSTATHTATHWYCRTLPHSAALCSTLRHMTHIIWYTSYDTELYESCDMYEYVMSHIWISHVSYIYESCLIYEYIMSHMWIRHVSHMKTSCHTYRRASQLMSHTYEWVMSYIQTSHVSFTNEWCLTYEWVMSHM